MNTLPVPHHNLLPRNLNARSAPEKGARFVQRNRGMARIGQLRKPSEVTTDQLNHLTDDHANYTYEKT